MKPKFEHLVKRPGGRRYDIFAKTDLAATFARLKREQTAAAREAESVRQEQSRKVRKLA